MPNDETAKQTSATSKDQSASDAIALLKADHRTVEKLFAEYEKAGTRARKEKIFKQIALALKVHAALEETIFYPAVRNEAEADDKLDEAQVEHDTLKILIGDLERGAASHFNEAKVKVLSEYVNHHVEEEEASDGILEQGRKAGLDLKKLGEQMAKRKEQLEADPSMIDSKPVSLAQPLPARTRRMASSQDSERSRTRQRSGEDDDRQRYTRRSREGDDENFRERARASRGSDREDRERVWDRQSSAYDDDTRDSYRGRGGYSRDEGEGSYSRASSYRSDEDDREGRGNGRSSRRGGWFGEREQSDMGRRRWESRH